jgi:hypothetical protein
VAELAAAGTRKSEARSDHWGRWTDGDLFRARKLDVEPALHGIEAAIWAAAYVWLGALDSPIEAMLYSVDSMTTRGASGLVLHAHWQMMGALEAANGTLLFGISTAYIFGVMLVYWPMLHRTRISV